MTDNNNQIIYCPYCKASMKIDELGEYVNANPGIKKQAIEEEPPEDDEEVFFCYTTGEVDFCFQTLLECERALADDPEAISPCVEVGPG